MELTFNKVGDLYVADFTAESDFALHIEKQAGYLRVKQTTVANAEYAVVRNACIDDSAIVIDEIFQSAIYPVHIRVEAVALPTKAVVTFA